MSVFAFAGVSTLNGKMKVRFANDQMRVKILQKNGHKDIDIVQLKTPMSNEDAVAYLLSIDFDNGNAEVRAALEDAQGKRATKAPKAKAAPTMEKIKAKVAKVKAAKAPVVDTTDMEDAPF